jgi:hypothetical protein
LPNRSSSIPLVRRLTKAEVPDESLIAVFGDLHIGEHDKPAADLFVECVDRAGASILVGNGDIYNCATVSHHPATKARAIAKYGDLETEAASGNEYTKWMASRGGCAFLGVGNHEDWINDVGLYSGLGSALSVRTALGIADNVEVLPHGYQLRLGSLAIEHGDIVLGRGSGGQNLARNILRRYPSQTTVVNHFHREDYAVSTSPDSSGVLRNRAAYSLGHLSKPEAHMEYAGRTPDWQQGFGMIRVWYEDNKPRYTIQQVQIHRTRRGRPIFEYDGHVYR